MLIALSAACASEPKPAAHPTTTATIATWETTSAAQPQRPSVDSVPVPTETQRQLRTSESPPDEGRRGPPPITSPGAASDGAAAADAGDQGNRAAERKITADIRKRMVTDERLSRTAKDAKVITTGTKVTLRGRVESEHERSLLEQLARRANGVTAVDSQLEVGKGVSLDR